MPITISPPIVTIEDNNQLMEIINSLGATATERYDVYEVQPNNFQWCYIVDIFKSFPDNSVWHHQHASLGSIQSLQQALLALVDEINEWSDLNPGY